MDRGVAAVLSSRQMPQFLERFGVSAEDLESRTAGWFKVVLICSDRAFLFPETRAES